jgi:NhaA family Na+:H+ antiporter
VTFVVLPVFAFANAGVTLSGDIGPSLGSELVLGIVLGLFVGKPIGIASFAWLAVKLGLADLPRGVTWRQILGVGVLGGIGFTMALFIAELAFVDVAQIDAAKIGILAASTVSALVGFCILAAATQKRPEKSGRSGSD